MYIDRTVGFTRAEAVGELGCDVTPHMVSMWALRGWIDPDTGHRRRLRVVGIDPDGTRRYRYGDLLAAESATRCHPNSRRRTLAA